jgi:hypothetical protein
MMMNMSSPASPATASLCAAKRGCGRLCTCEKICLARRRVLQPTARANALAQGMIMIVRTAAAVIAALCWLAPLHAEEAAPDSVGGRYIFSKLADGYLRLDTQSGEVAQCSPHSVGWACQAAPEDRAVLEAEIARLRSENAEQKKELLARGLLLPPEVNPPAAQNGAPPTSLPNLRLPSDADIDRMMAFVGRVWQRFVEAVQRAEKQVFNKG